MRNPEARREFLITRCPDGQRKNDSLESFFLFSVYGTARERTEVASRGDDTLGFFECGFGLRVVGVDVRLDW